MSHTQVHCWQSFWEGQKYSTMVLPLRLVCKYKLISQIVHSWQNFETPSATTLFFLPICESNCAHPRACLQCAGCKASSAKWPKQVQCSRVQLPSQPSQCRCWGRNNARKWRKVNWQAVQCKCKCQASQLEKRTESKKGRNFQGHNSTINASHLEWIDMRPWHFKDK